MKPYYNTVAGLISLGTIFFGQSMLSAGTTDHLDMGLELVEHLLEYQTAGQFEDGNQVELNQYGGSWGAGTLLVEPGDPDSNQFPYNLSKCGSFVTKLLNHSYNWSWSNYQLFDPNEGQMVTTASPNAHRYMELITQQVGFKHQIFQIADILPGDIMVKRDVGTTKGHVWVIKEVILAQPMPYLDNMPASQIHLSGTTYYEVDVLDCSEGYHSNDSRKVFFNGQLHETHGAGIGTIGLLVDANGTVIGHTWSLPTAAYNNEPDSWVSELNSKLELLEETELVIGRLNLSISQSGTMDDITTTEDPDPSGETSNHDTVNSNATQPDDSSQVPDYLQLGRLLLNQIEACHAEGIFNDQDGVQINRNGGKWGSSSSPAMIRFADLDQGILPANNNKGTTLVSLLLKEMNGFSWRDYTYYDTKKDEVRKTSSPGSTQYVDMIEQGVGFSQQIHSFTDAVPGDVLAIRYISNWSGHTMMVNHIDWNSAVEYPDSHPDAQSIWAGSWFIPVQVLDSTSNPHSFDTREVGDIEYEGIGTGTIGVLINENCKIIGHTWSLPSANPSSDMDRWISSLHSRLKPQEERKMVVGRF